MTQPIRAGTVNLARLMPETSKRADAIIAEVNSMNLDVIGFQETEEWLEARLDRDLKGVWTVVSDRANCPVMVRGDLFERIPWNGKPAIGMTLPGSVRSRYGSAAFLRRRSDGFRFTVANIHPSNNGESSHMIASKDRIRQAEACWNYLKQWGVTEFPIILVGDMNDLNMPPKGLPGVFTGHGATDILQKLGQKARIDRAFLWGFDAISATVNPVASSASDHDFGLFVVAPTVTQLHGADVSSWQGFDWIPAAGDTFTFVKASEGSSYTNPARWSQLSAARTAGHQVGHYHFMHPGDAVQQAQFFVNSAQVLSGELMVCDWENTEDGHPSVSDAAEFIAEVKRLLPENKCGLYCNRNDWMTTTVKAGDFLWIAEYGVDKPNTKSDWVFWQHSRTPIDQNWSKYTDLDELKTWAGNFVYSQKWDAEYVSWKGGGNVTVQDAAILTALDEASWDFWRGIFLTQGGLSTSVKASAYTHAGLGCFDIRTRNNTRAELWRLTSMFLRSGIVLFPRGYNVGFDFFRNTKHGHCVSRESYDSLHPSAKFQYKEYIAGGDGLVGSAQYTGPSTKFERWVTSPYNAKNITEDANRYVVDVSSGFLWGLDVDRKKKVARDKGETVQAAQQVKRWGRDNVVTADETFFALDYLEVVT